MSDSTAGEVSLSVFLGCDVLVFEHTEELIYGPWDHDVISPQSPVAGKLKERIIDE